jgi:prophage antirepressor-like protein
MTELIEKIDMTLSFNKNTIRILGTHDKPIFVAKDICKILGISNITEAMRKIPEKWRGSVQLNTLGGKQEMLTVTEPGVYKFVMRSDKPIAEKFQEWVCEDVLPSIRKKGDYVLEEYKKQLEEQQKITEEQKKQLEEQQKKTKEDQKRIKLLENKVLKKQPRVHYEETNVIYLLTTKEHKKKRIYIVGRACDLADRLSTYDKTCPHQVIHYRGCPSYEHMIITETMVLCTIMEYREVANHDRFILPADKDISLFKNAIDECVDFFKSKKVDPKKIEEHKEKIKPFASKDYREQSKGPVKKGTDLSRKKSFKRRRLMSRIFSMKNQGRLQQYGKLRYQRNKQRFSERWKNYYRKNISKMTQRNKIYRENNKELIRAKAHEKYHKNPEKNAKDKREWRGNNIERARAIGRKAYHNNREKNIERNKKYKEEHREQLLKSGKERYEKNKEKLNKERLEKITCECGAVIVKSGKSRHILTKKHTEGIAVK